MALEANSNNLIWKVNPISLTNDYQKLQYFAWAGEYFGSHTTPPVGPFPLDASLDNAKRAAFPDVYPNIGGAVMGLEYNGADTQHWIQLVGTKEPPPVPAFKDDNGVNWFVDVLPGQKITTVGPWYDIGGAANTHFFLDVPSTPPDPLYDITFYTFVANSFDPNTLTITVGNVGVNWGVKEPIVDPVVPEPSTLALLSWSGIGLVVACWRRRKQGVRSTRRA